MKFILFTRHFFWLANEPAYQNNARELKAQLQELLRRTGVDPDKMPLDEGIKTALPEKSRR